jgi:hypothetical protein
MSNEEINDEVFEKQDKEALFSAAKRRELEMKDLREMLDSPVGIRVLRKIMDRCGVLRLGFDADNQHITALEAGRRDIGLFLLKESLEADPTAITTLLSPE